MMKENDIFSIYNVRQPVRQTSEFLLGTVKMKKIFFFNIGMWGVNPEDLIW